MRTKRKTRQMPEVSLRRHLRKLGFSEANEYRQWCELNGFSQDLHKCAEDRLQELLLSLATGPNWHRIAQQHNTRLRIRVQGSNEEIFEKILSGHLTACHVASPELRPLQSAVLELRERGFGSSETLATLRKLIKICENHGLQNLLESSSSHSQRLSCTFVGSIARLAVYEKHWIRPAEQWRPMNCVGLYDTFRSLAQHLFVRFSCPDFLISTWLTSDFWSNGWLFQVFRHVAAGHSIRTVGLGIDYNKPMSHYFLLAPRSFSVWQALRWGQVLGMGGSEQLARAVAKSSLGKRIDRWEFWRTFVHWLIDHPDFPLDRLDDVLRYVNNQRFGNGNLMRCFRDQHGNVQQEAVLPAQPHLSMRGRTVIAILRETDRWLALQQMYGADSQFTWDGSPIRPFRFVDQRGIRWTITELLGNGALLEEGQALHHCVGGYFHRCIQGVSTIWSLSIGMPTGRKRVLTLEVNAASREIVQARGLANRVPSSEELNILQRWCNAAGLWISC